jgi:hypothetical protein
MSSINNPFTDSDNLTIKSYGTYAEMMEANPRYKNSIVYCTDAAADAAAERQGDLFDGALFSILIQNCDDVATAVMRAGGIKVNHGLTPNRTFANQVKSSTR